MFKKVLCWLLIIQHVNVYVLHAAPHDIKISFSEEIGENNAFRYRLMIIKENEVQRKIEILNQPIEFVNQKLAFPIGTSLDNWKLSDKLIKDSFKIFINKQGKVSLSSLLPQNQFSLELSQDGLADLGEFDTSNLIELHTFGLIRTNQDIKSDKLNFVGRDFHNNKHLNVGCLNITLSKLQSSSENAPNTVNESIKKTYREIINGPRGKITINKEANIKAKSFENQGKIEGKDLSVLKLNGTNLLNKKTNDNSQITWDGTFSIKGVGKLTNEGNIQPTIKSQYSSLTLDARSLQNFGNILAKNHLSIRTLQNFENEGEINSTQKTAIHVRGNLNNNNLISSDDELKVDVLGDLYTGEKGQFSGNRTFINVLGKTENEGNLKGETFSLITQSLKNANKIEIGKDGAIILRDPTAEILNTSAAQIISQGILRLSGGNLINEGDEEKKGLVKAKTLVGTLSAIANSGHIEVSEKLGLILQHFYNAEGGTWNFPSEGGVASEEFSNTKEVTTDAFQLTTQVFENFGKVISKSEIVLEIGKVFKNAADALLSFVGGFTVTGKGEVHNDGDIVGIGQVNIETDKSTNNGAIVSDTGVKIKSPQAFNNEGLVLSPDIDIETNGGGNRGKTSESIDFSNPMKLEGLIAQRSLRLNTTGEFTNSGHMFGGMGVTLSGEGTFINEERLDSQGLLESEVQTFINEGDVAAKAGNLKGHILDNYGMVYLEEASNLHFDDLQNKEGGSLTSKEGLNLGFTTFGNQGTVTTDKFVSFDGRDLKNEGEVRSEVLTTGTVSKDTEGQFTHQQSGTALDTFENDGIFHGSALVNVKAVTLDNKDEVSSKGDVNLEFERNFSNEEGALVSALEDLTVKGDGEAYNAGNMESQNTIDIDVAKARNTGQVISENEIRVHTKKGSAESAAKDFDNEGLFLSTKINVHIANGSNKGELSETIDLANQGALKGLVASESLNVTIDETFKNAGQMTGGHLVKLDGTGVLDNAGDINHSDTIHSQLKQVENTGVVRAHQEVKFEQLTEEFNNPGLVLSDGKLSVSSTSKVKNSGFMEGRHGDVDLSTNDIENTGLISALTGKLNLETAQGTNQNHIFGKEGIKLQVKELFTNVKTSEVTSGTMESHGDVKVEGLGRLVNNNTITAAKDIRVTTGLENAGDIKAAGNIHVQSTNKDFINTSEGKLITPGKVDVENGKSFGNEGLLQGAEASVTSTGHFSNKGLISAETGAATVNIKAGVNDGTISGKTKADIDISDFFENGGNVLSPETVSIHGQGKLTNKEGGALTAGGLLDVSQIQVDNSGALTSKQSVRVHDLNGKLENKATGQIVSEGTTSVENVATFDNLGKVQGHKGSTISVTNLANNGEISSPEGAVNITTQTGSNADKGVISSKTNTTVTTSQDFTNNGDIAAEQTVTLNGQGKVTNNHNIQGNTTTVNVANLTNNKDILSKENFAVSGASHLANGVNGNVVSEGDIEAGPNTKVTNEGLMSANGSVVFNQSELTLRGQIEATSNINFPNLTSLTMLSESALVSEKGQVLMPILITLANKGNIFSHGNFVLQRLQTATNDGIVQSNGAILFTLTDSIRNNKLINGVGGVLINSPNTLNNGDVVSGKTLGIKSIVLENNKLLAGDAGVTINDPKMKTIKQGVNGKIESAKGNVTIASKKEDLKGVVSGQDIEVKITDKTIVQGKTTFVPQKLLKLIPGKGFVVQSSLTFDHAFTLIGELINDRNAPLLVKGDFTWNKPTALSNKFDITTEGKFALIIPAAWVNLANVHAHAGSAINVLQFLNGNVKVSGTFYSYGGTVFVCPSGFANRGMFEAWGNLGIDSKNGDIANFPGAILSQRNTSKGKDTVKFVTSKNVTNTSGTVNLEGKLNSTSDLFVNKQTPFEKKELNKFEDYFMAIRKKRSNKFTSRVTKFPVSRDIPQPRASFAAGEAVIKANELQNVGIKSYVIGYIIFRVHG